MLAQKYIALFPVVLVLTACGGGGGSDESKTSSTHSSQSSVLQSSSSSSVVSSLSSSSVSSVISSSSSSLVAGNTLTVSVAGNILVKNENGEIDEVAEDDDISISLSLLDENQAVLKSNKSEVINGEEGRFGFSDQLSATNAKFVVVHISKPGYTDFARRFDFNEKIELQSEISKLPTAFVEVAQAETISGEVVNGFNFSVTDNLLGESDSGYGKELSVFIPQSALPQGTNTLEVQMKAYDPTDPEEAAYFPGAYEDSEGNKLLSIAFNYTEVKTDQGISLQQVARQVSQERIAAQKAGRLQKTEASEPVIINRMIPTESCRALATMGDSDSSTAGFQIPVYTYNPVSGLWDLLGQGSVFNEDGELLASNFSGFDCDSVDYMLEIKVTNEIFISNWWNLDYPLVFEQPVTLCAKVKLLDQGNSPLAGTYVYAFDDDENRSFSASGFVADAEGNVTVSLVKLNSNDPDSSVTLSAWSPVDGGMLEKTIELSTEACTESAPVIPVQLSIPSRCQVKGTLLDKNAAPLSNGLMLALAENDDLSEANYGTEFAFTDEQGKYSLNLFCEQNYELADYVTWVSNIDFETGEQSSLPKVNVNGTTGADEITDDSKLVQFKDLVSAPKPWGMIFNTEGSVEFLEANIYYSGEDFPLSYSFDLIDAQTQAVIKHFEGSVTEAEFIADGDFSFANIQIRHGIELPPETQFLSYQISGEIKDAKDVKGKLWGIFILTSEIVSE
jgi:hypothetical protein